MAGCHRDDLGPPLVGQGGEGVAAIGRVGPASHQAALLEAAHHLREAGQRPLGEKREVAHPQGALGGLGQGREHAVVLWIAAGLLALAFLAAGGAKVVQPKEKLAASGMAWVEDFSAPAVRTIGLVEVLGAIGLILPALTGIAPVLVPLAALGLALAMVGAVIVHLRRGEKALAPVVVLFVLAVVVAVGRFGAVPFTA